MTVAREMAARGERLRGVRLDSGDLGALAREVRQVLDDAGFTDAQIFASGGLDEDAVDALLAGGAPIDAFGLGDRGADETFAIVYPPQVAIVGFGRMAARPWVEGRIVPRPVVRATLSADHRVTDGHRGGLFLAAVDRRLQEPDTL